VGVISYVGIATTLALLDGLQPVASAEQQPAGWATMVSPHFAVTDLTVLSPVVFNVSVRQAGSYRLASPESVRLTIPAASVQYSLASVLATPLLVASPSSAYAELGGTLLTHNDEVSLRDPFASAAGARLTIRITLYGADWGPFTQAEDYGVGPTSDLLRGIRSAQSEATGFNNVIAPLLRARDVTKSGDQRTIIITIPPAPSYDVIEPETITITGACREAGERRRADALAW